MSQALLEELANAVAATLAEQAADVAVVVDLPARRVRVTQSGTLYEVYLGNAYEEYVRAAPAERSAIVAKYASTVSRGDVAGGDVAPPSAVDWQHLLPKLAPRRERALMALRFGTVTNLPTGIAITDDLALELGLDLPDQIRVVTQSDLASAEMSEAGAFELARRHLLARSREPWERLTDGLYQSPWGDYFDGARLALPTLFPRIGVRGAPVVTIPNRCAVLVTGTQEPVGLAVLAKATRMLMEKERPIHVAPLVLADGTWLPLTGLFGSALLLSAPELRQLFSLQQALDYQAIGEHVRAALEEVGFRVEALQQGEMDGERFTATNLPRVDGVVIPRADLVVCGDAMFTFDKLEAILGKNLVPLEIWPPHYQVRRAPTLVEIAAVRMR